MECATPTRLSERLRRDTAALHQQAERCDVMAALIGGTIERAAYVALLRNLRLLYVALEAALEPHRADPRFAFTCAAPLPRAQRIAQDIDVLAHGAPAAAPLAAAERYAQHLAALGAQQPLRLVAHAYVRYLGDLHGGQMLARGLRLRFDLSGDEGTHCYGFGPPQALPALRAAFRAGLDALPLAPAEADAIVDEARSAYARHLELFDALAPSLNR